MHATPHHIDRFWQSDWSLSSLLVFLILFLFFLHPLHVLGYEGSLIGDLAFTLVLISGIVTVARTRVGALLFGVVAVVCMAVHWARYAVFGDAWMGKDAIATLVACGMLAAIVLVQVFREGPITSPRIQGAIAAYLLIALMFANLFTWIDLHSAKAFSESQPAAAAPDDPLARFQYFSFTTLTTVGYGDVVPVQPFARSMAMLEALIGQIFPSILLARLVSMELYYRQVRAEHARAGTGSGQPEP